MIDYLDIRAICHSSFAEEFIDDELEHHGVKGQKWGVRRFQNEDGTLTEAGKERYGNSDSDDYSKKLDKMSQDEIVEYFDTGENASKNRTNYENHLRKRSQEFLNKNSDKVKELEEKTGVKIDIYKLAPTLKEYRKSAADFDFQDLIYDYELSDDLTKFVYELDSINMTYAGLYDDPHFGRDRMYHSDDLAHHGIKGQRWGIRRYQNDDGTLTAEGRKRYGVDNLADMSKEQRKLYEQDRRESLKSAKADIKRQGLKTNYIGGSKNLERLNRGADIIRSKYGQLTLDDFAADESKKATRVAIGTSLVAMLASFGGMALLIKAAS